MEASARQLAAQRDNKLHSTICIVLLTEFVSWNVWLQHVEMGSLGGDYRGHFYITNSLSFQEEYGGIFIADSIYKRARGSQI